MLLSPQAGAPVERELLRLVLAVLLLDALFIAGFFLLRLEHTSGSVKIGYTPAWTIAALVVLLRALTRIWRLHGR